MFEKITFFKTEDNVLAGDKRIKSERKKIFASLNSLKNGVGSGSISQRSGSAPTCHGSPILDMLLSAAFA
jgi:hypothetical protein